MQMLGQGSLNVIHVHGRPVRRPEDITDDPQLQALFALEMLERGRYLSRRGLSALSCHWRTRMWIASFKRWTTL